MTTRVMLDLETLGTQPGSMILSIGAVKFDLEAGDVTSTFHRRISMEDSSACRFAVDISTLRWWVTQSDNAKEAAFAQDGSITVKEALLDFAGWCIGELDDSRQPWDERSKVEDFNAAIKGIEMWGNGSDFDNVLLSTYYVRAGIVTPWMFWNNRCYRTVKNMHRSVELTRIGVHHNAVDDAESQARHLMAIYKAHPWEVTP